MKLTEQQLAQLFQDNTQAHQSMLNVADALDRPNLSDAESIVNDYSTAQATRQAVQFKIWSQNVAKDIQQRHQKTGRSSIKSFISKWLPNAPLATTTLAVVFTLSAVILMNDHQTSTKTSNADMVNEDVINSMPFEGNNDRLSRGGFDGESKSDQLFNANFS